jgi:23S rRNA pseudouridine1911/1915/1917 synthase
VRFRAESPGARVDRFLADRLGTVGRRLLAAAFEDGKVRVNGKRARKGDRLRAGDEVELADEAVELHPVPQADLPLEVLFQDQWLVAGNKPPGMPSHPLRAGERGTFANSLVARFPECAAASEDPREGGVTHRLDAGTTGVLLAARDPETWRAVRELFGARRVSKEYLALVTGEVTAGGTVRARLAHAGENVRVVETDGMDAVTRYEPARRFVGFTLLRCVAETGRPHQVRVHLAHLGHPIVGDAHYGTATELAGHFLHASRLELTHPQAGAPLVIEAPLPADRLAWLAGLTAR